MIAVAGVYGAGPVALAAASPVVQQSEQDDALKMMKRGEILPYSRIRSIVRKELGGTLVGEKLRRTNSGWVYEVRVRRSDGRVMFAILDAKTGRIINRY